MLKIAIAEDEASARTALKKYLDHWQTENGQPVQATFFESGSHLLENVPQGLQLALLDIQMPGLSGMETARRLRETLPELEIVFITSLTGYALESYEVAALDYLVKPVSYPRFCRSLERACRRISQQTEHILTIKKQRWRVPSACKETCLRGGVQPPAGAAYHGGCGELQRHPCRTGKGFRKRLFPLPQLFSDQSGACDPAGRC